MLAGGNVVADGTYSYVWGAELITNFSVFYVYNAHGDVVQLLDIYGSVIKTYDYDAYGNELERDLADTNPFRYCGEYYDTETGFIYLRARYYDPVIGRFISSDPAHDGLNWYTYCNDNPIAFVDKNGLWPTWGQVLTAGIIIAVAAVAVVVTVASAGTAGAAIGLGVSMAVGASGATAATLTTVATAGCYVLAGAIGAGALSDVNEVFTGYNPIRDSFMDGNQDLYDATRSLLYIGSAGITTLAASNPGLKNLYSSKNDTVPERTPRPESANDIDPDLVYKSASDEYGNGLTLAGHAFEKHAKRDSGMWGAVKGNFGDWNEMGMKNIYDIMNAEGEFKQIVGGNGIWFWEKYLPDGRGLRLNQDGTFKGFVIGGLRGKPLC